MIVSAWHSIEVEEGTKKVPVYHHNSSCKTGQNVEKNRRRYGTDNRPLCQTCARLDAEGR